MERVDVLKRLVELNESGEVEFIHKTLEGMTYDELMGISATFKTLAKFAEDAPRESKDV